MKITVEFPSTIHARPDLREQLTLDLLKRLRDEFAPNEIEVRWVERDGR